MREDGIADLFWRGLRWLGIYRRFILLGGRGPRVSSKPQVPVECSKLEADQIDEYLAFRPGQSGDMIRRRFADGQWCFVGRCDGRMAATSWVCRRRAWLDFLDCEILLADGVCYPHDTYALPEFRGLGVSDVVSAFRTAYFRKAGYDLSIGIVEPENRAAMRRSKRKRTPVIGQLDCIRLGPWRRLRIRLDAEGLGELVRLSESQ